jgi:hypothetical protein
MNWNGHTSSPLTFDFGCEDLPLRACSAGFRHCPASPFAARFCTVVAFAFCPYPIAIFVAETGADHTSPSLAGAVLGGQSQHGSTSPARKRLAFAFLERQCVCRGHPRRATRASEDGACHGTEYELRLSIHDRASSSLFRRIAERPIKAFCPLVDAVRVSVQRMRPVRRWSRICRPDQAAPAPGRKVGVGGTLLLWHFWLWSISTAA